MDSGPLTFFSQTLANVGLLLYVVLDSMDVTRTVRSDDDEKGSTVRVLSEKSETRPADEDPEARKTLGPRGGGDSVEMFWYSIS